MCDFFKTLKEKVSAVKPSIVFPEGEDIRVLGAAIRLLNDGVLKPVVLGKRDELLNLAKENGLSAEGLEIINPSEFAEMEELVAAFVERRKGKIEEADARKLLNEVPNYFGTLLVHTGRVDGLVSGAINSTGDTVRPALQIIKMKPGYKKTSGCFIMLKGEQKYLFADCAINIAPDAADLAESAVLAAQTAHAFGIDPKIAMLSFSTKGSANSEETQRVAEATRLAKEMAPELALDGELQFDAAFDMSVAKKKAPESTVAGCANVFIFPSLEAGNIGYKLVQRLGEFEAIGPVLQGLNKPVNDLSRGCSEEDVYKLAMITAAQSL